MNQHGFFITGTDTGVGKTEITAAIASLYAARGVTVHPRKPVESGCERDSHGEELFPEDAATLQIASGTTDSLAKICPYRFSQPISPERAAAISGTTLTLQMVTEACQLPTVDGEEELLLVEGAGGFYSPIAEQALNADLANALNLQLILVVEDRLGAVNQLLTARHAILDRGLEISLIILNRHSNSEMNNLDSISARVDEMVIPVTAHGGNEPWREITKELAELPLPDPFRFSGSA